MAGTHHAAQQPPLPDAVLLSEPLQLLVDGRALSARGAGRGFGTYIRNQVARFAADEGLQVKVLITEGADVPNNVETVLVRRFAPRGAYFVEQALRTPGDIKRIRPDVFFSTSNDPPRHSAVPWVQTFYDVIPLTLRQSRTAYARAIWRARARWMGRADRLVAISQFSASEAVRILKLDAARLEVVYPGVDSSFRPATQRTQPDPPFVLFVSGYGPHKGYDEAFRVIAALAERGLPHRLKVAGRLGPVARRAVEALLARAGAPERVDLLDFVGDDELRQLYQAASLTVITSRSEGFCLPAVESMACGTPVIAFANSAIPEAVGDGGVLVADGNVAAFADAAAALLQDPSAWAQRAQAGLRHASGFSWDQNVARHVEIFRELTR